MILGEKITIERTRVRIVEAYRFRLEYVLYFDALQNSCAFYLTAVLREKRIPQRVTKRVRIREQVAIVERCSMGWWKSLIGGNISTFRYKFRFQEGADEFSLITRKRVAVFMAVIRKCGIAVKSNMKLPLESTFNKYVK